jgi:outer membrane lipoprotein-sorting protein
LTFGVKDQPGGQTFVVQKMEINPEIDESEFKFPEEENQE